MESVDCNATVPSEKELVMSERNADRIGIAVRVPKDVKEWLEREAARTGASQNSEIVRAVRVVMDLQERREKVS
jgi:hypothetical protein